MVKKLSLCACPRINYPYMQYRCTLYTLSHTYTQKNDLKTGQKAFRNSFVCDVTTKFQFIKCVCVSFFPIQFFGFIRFHMKIYNVIIPGHKIEGIIGIPYSFYMYRQYTVYRQRKEHIIKIFFENWISFKKKVRFFVYFVLI